MLARVGGLLFGVVLDLRHVLARHARVSDARVELAFGVAALIDGGISAEEERVCETVQADCASRAIDGLNRCQEELRHDLGLGGKSLLPRKA